MYSDKLREIPNPYDYSTHRLSSTEFVGREKHIDEFKLILEEFSTNNKIRNLLISGEKSIGKSSLLYRFERILADYNFYTFNIELSKDANNKIDEFDFFKEFINNIFENYAPVENTCLDAFQQEIWYSLTSFDFKHDSSYLERQIGFATQYSNRVKGFQEKLSEKTLERDIANLINAFSKFDTDNKGIAILIDEFQELKRNPDLLDLLRQLSEAIPGLLIVGAGLPKLPDDPSFEKFCRTSHLINLTGLEENEILNLVFKPIEINAKFSRYEAKMCFDPETIQEIVDRSGGNPLHIRILCAKLFEHFKNSSDIPYLKINRDVMEDVMTYYSTVSTKSSLIKNALQSCSKEQLNTFGKLYYYEGLDLRSIIMLKLAFESIQANRQEEIKNKLIDEINELYDLKLFSITSDINPENLYDQSLLSLSRISYSFIGDKIDKLYVSYYFEELTEEKLKHNENKRFEDLLLRKMSNELNQAVYKEKIPKEATKFSFSNFSDQKEYKSQEILLDYDALSKINLEESQDKKKMARVREISEKHRLDYPAQIASNLELSGYYVLMTEATIKGQKKIIKTYFPLVGSVEKIIKIREQIIDYTKLFNASLDEYLITINWMYLYWLPYLALKNIIYVDLNNETSVLLNRVSERNFEDAVNNAERITDLTAIIKSGRIGRVVDHVNDYAFCLLNLNNIEEAKKLFSELQDKYLLSKINYSFILVQEGNWQEGKRILKNLLKKKSQFNVKFGYLHLAIIHKKLAYKHMIVEDSSLFNMLCWNLALIFAYFENNEDISNSYLKKIKLETENDKNIHKRVSSWIDFYFKRYDSALKSCKQILENADSNNYLYIDVIQDKKLFESVKQ